MQPDHETKTERVQLLMSPSELKEVDEWAYKNRIRTRSEAIRQLVNASLKNQLYVERKYSEMVKNFRFLATSQLNKDELKQTTELLVVLARAILYNIDDIANGDKDRDGA